MKKICALLIAGILLISVVLTGCSAVPHEESVAEDSMTSTENKAVVAPEEAGTGGAGTGVSIPADERKIIRNADVSIKSNDIDKSVSQVQGAVKTAGGYVSASYSSSDENSDSKQSRLTCRIPSEKYDSFMEGLPEFGKVLSKDENTEDVTADYIDVEAKIKSLKAQEQRLYELLEKAGSLENLIAIQNQITEVQYQIDSNTGRLNQMKELISYCTVTISITQREETITPINDSFGSQIGAAFQNMWNGVINGSQSFVIIFIYALPILIILLVILAIVLVTIKFYKNKKKIK